MHKITFQDWGEIWLPTLEVGPNTLAGYRSLLKNHHSRLGIFPAQQPRPLRHHPLVARVLYR